MESWIQEQSAKNNNNFEGAMLTKYPDAARYTVDPNKYFERVCLECNYLDAIKLFDWGKIIPTNARILDLAGGTGWLSAYLSTFPQAKEITIVDSSHTYLDKNLPVSAQRLGGKLEKIKPIEGFFTPLFIPDASMDLVVVSSSLHHADNLEAVLKEIHRVLAPGRKCYILNETPADNILYFKVMLMTFLRILLKTLKREFLPTAPSISASGFLYDTLLGDRMFPDWYWVKAIERAGFTLEERIDSKMPTVKNDSKGWSLVHYVCKKTI
jgi:SAM-dependent methyltransferase